MLQKIMAHCLLVFVAVLGLISPGAPLALAAPPATLSPELVSCLQTQVGASVIDEISSGARQPTEAEANQSETCFKQYGSPIAKDKPEIRDQMPQFSTGTASCLKKTLGEDYQKQLSNVSSETEGSVLRQKAGVCFDKDANQSRDGKIPDAVKSCIIKAVGQAQFDVMLKGDKPQAGSDLFKKLEGAGCFKQLKHEGAPLKDLPDDKRKCIEGIMGSAAAEPTEAQRQEVGKKCFAGQGEGNHTSDHPQLPDDVKKCLEGAVGQAFQSKSPDSLTDDERALAGACFKQNDFKPEGGPRGEAPKMDKSVKDCIKSVTGHAVEERFEINDDTKNTVNQQCFGGRGGPEGGSAIKKTNTELNDCTDKIVASSGGTVTPAVKERILKECHAGGEDPNKSLNQSQPITSDKSDCTARVVAGITDQLPQEEVQKRVNEACYADRNYGKPQVDDGTNHASGADTTRSAPPAGTDDGGAYCAQNPAACTGPKP